MFKTFYKKFYENILNVAALQKLHSPLMFSCVFFWTVSSNKYENNFFVKSSFSCICTDFLIKLIKKFIIPFVFFHQALPSLLCDRISRVNPYISLTYDKYRKYHIAYEIFRIIQHVLLMSNLKNL